MLEFYPRYLKITQDGTNHSFKESSLLPLRHAKVPMGNSTGICQALYHSINISDSNRNSVSPCVVGVLIMKDLSALMEYLKMQGK